ncbi:hypothetical protein K7X08_033797 [Anisodus acutangulus]|uniref:Uncharacterized protein n=1 Tax=Anisodus acutangulus TaxID=402998 RepID=A0A9Q1M3B0_9SOLA|nr:hypothetical protein K7X08_033797 [Anisodus acutangulus]
MRATKWSKEILGIFYGGCGVSGFKVIRSEDIIGKMSFLEDSVSSEEGLIRKPLLPPKGKDVARTSFRDDSASSEQGLQKPLLHTGSWYRMASRQSSIMESSAQILHESISIYLCVLIVALGSLQFGFTV